MPSLNFGNNIESSYLFARREPGLFIEIYFPKRVLYQSAVIDALTAGVDGKKVKTYMKRNADRILSEFAEYPYVFDSLQYSKDYNPPHEITVEDVKERINIYENPFFGWSSYDVEGAFLSKSKKSIDDELTQIVRIIFRFESRHMEKAKKERCEHILRSIVS